MTSSHASPDQLAEILEARRRLAIAAIRSGAYDDSDLSALGLTRPEAELARRDGTYRLKGEKARLWSAPLLLASFSDGNLAAATGATGRTRQLEPYALGTLALGDDGQNVIHLMLAHAVVSSSGAGNVRTDAEGDIRRLLGHRRGDMDEVAVGFVPGLRPRLYDGDGTTPGWMRRGLPG